MRALEKWWERSVLIREKRQCALSCWEKRGWLKEGFSLSMLRSVVISIYSLLQKLACILCGLKENQCEFECYVINIYRSFFNVCYFYFKFIMNHRRKVNVNQLLCSNCCRFRMCAAITALGFALNVLSLLSSSK